MTIDVRTKAGREELRALAEAATPAPWESSVDSHAPGNGKCVAWVEAEDGHVANMHNWPFSAKDAAFIAAARQAVPDLLEALEEAGRRIEALEGAFHEANSRADEDWLALKQRAEAAERELDVARLGSMSAEGQPKVRGLCISLASFIAEIDESSSAVAAYLEQRLSPILVAAEAAEAALEVAREALTRISWVDPMGTPVPADYLQRIARDALKELPAEETT